ncbi:MAG: hypothetical protein PHI23_04315, partial [Candidatus Peribacteraceae bacterium]|nr:hypothetical protein [Candidatus Peribacteraceae bacterium]
FRLLLRSMTDFSTKVRKCEDAELGAALSACSQLLLQLFSVLTRCGVEPEGIAEALRRRRGASVTRPDCSPAAPPLQ